MEQCPAPFPGQIVQPCKEPRRSVAGFAVLTVEIIQIEKKTHKSQDLNLRQWLVACFLSLTEQYYFFCGIKRICRTMLHGFMHNHAEAKKHVQEDKKNRCWRWTVLNGGI